MPSPYAEAHAKPGGPDDARPTALDIVKDEGLQGKLSGKASKQPRRSLRPVPKSLLLPATSQKANLHSLTSLNPDGWS
ncbi:MAG: hypothetical protein Q9183_003364 [Haloplaca sp. 2 TL-2023]